MTTRTLSLLFAVASAGVLAPCTARAEESPTVATSGATAGGGRRARGFGLGLGSGTIANGLSAKDYLGGAALQGVVGLWGGGGFHDRFRHANGLAVSADYLFEMPSLTSSQFFTLDWSFGLGAGFGVDDFRGRSPGLAASGVAGLEFNFTRIPLDVVVEYRPTLAILSDVHLHLVDFTAHVRFYF
jgi:hypothetical protein